MFRLDHVSLADVNQFLQELNESGATEIDVQFVASADAGAPVMEGASEPSDTPTPYIAVFVVYTPKENVARPNLGLGPYD
jgi:hypothetical protein